MVSNLLKSPLVAILFASLLFFTGVFMPFSDEHVALMGQFSAPLLSHLFQIVLALLISMAAAVVFASSEKKGMSILLMLSLSILGAVWIVPVIEPLVFNPSPGQLGLIDSIWYAAQGIVCTVLILVLVQLLYRTESHNQDSPSKPKFVYKLKPLDLIIRVVALPFIFCVLFFTSWYFLHWANADVRAFYGGIPENPGFVPSVVNALLYDTWMLPLSLLQGLGYTLSALPLLFLFPGKKVIFIASTTMIYLANSAKLLIATPYMPDAVRMSCFIYVAGLLLVFGIAAGLILHTSFAKQSVAVEEPVQPRQTLQPGTKTPAVKQAAGAAVKQGNK